MALKYPEKFNSETEKNLCLALIFFINDFLLVRWTLG